MATETVTNIELFKQTAESLNPVIKDLQGRFTEWQNIINKLRADWQGDTSDNVRNTANQLSKSSEDLLKSIQAWQSTLNQMAGIYVRTENKAIDEGKNLKFNKAGIK